MNVTSKLTEEHTGLSLTCEVGCAAGDRSVPVCARAPCYALSHPPLPRVVFFPHLLTLGTGVRQKDRGEWDARRVGTARNPASYSDKAGEPEMLRRLIK